VVCVVGEAAGSAVVAACGVLETGRPVEPVDSVGAGEVGSRVVGSAVTRGVGSRVVGSEVARAVGSGVIAATPLKSAHVFFTQSSSSPKLSHEAAFCNI